MVIILPDGNTVKDALVEKPNILLYELTNFFNFITIFYVHICHFKQNFTEIRRQKFFKCRRQKAPAG